MRKVNFKNSRNLNLVGNLHHKSFDSIIIMCHGFTSDKNSRGRFDKLAKSFNELGFSALAFDFSGCGESDNDSLTMDKEVDDLKSAISFVKDNGYKKIALFGHSLGSAICLKSCSTKIVTMVLSGALTDSMKYDWEDYYTKTQLRELEEKGYITEKSSSSERDEIIVDKQMLLDFELVNQKEIFKNISCPILIIHGDNDEEERLLCERSVRGIKLLNNGSKLEIINGANHSFLDHLHILTDLTCRWFSQYL